MCGRYTIILDSEDMQTLLALGQMPGEYRRRYNVAPTQNVPVVLDGKTRDVQMMRWGLVPSWAKRITTSLNNARAETITEKPTFKEAFLKRRCLLLATGFYEWKKGNGVAIPYYFSLQKSHPFAFAGVWDEWVPPHEDKNEALPLKSCTIITTVPNSLMANIHERMPVMLAGEDMWRWLSDSSVEELLALLQPFTAEPMRAWPVSTAVNSPRIEDTALIEPLRFSASRKKS